jgi:G:T-mismatch repair DNA endonuclease (very short patch repair protein)
MARLEQITRAGYVVEVIWECEFDEGILAHHPDLQVRTIVEHIPLNTRDALYGG